MFIEKTKLSHPLVVEASNRLMDSHETLKKIQVIMHAKYLG